MLALPAVRVPARPQAPAPRPGPERRLGAFGAHGAHGAQGRFEKMPPIVREPVRAAGGAGRVGPIRIGIVDDHPIVRSALRSFLETQEGLRVVGEASSGREAIDLVRKHAIDVLLLDVDMPGQGGIDALARIKARTRVDPLGVLMFSGYPEDLYAVRFIRNGASGYLNKSCDPAEIAAAIRSVAQGGHWITPVVAELLADEVLAPNAGGGHQQFSVRELQVFLKLARGADAQQVAAELSLSPKTVSTHRARVMRKLQAHSASDLTYYAVKHGLVD